MKGSGVINSQNSVNIVYGYPLIKFTIEEKSGGYDTTNNLVRPAVKSNSIYMPDLKSITVQNILI